MDLCSHFILFHLVLIHFAFEICMFTLATMWPYSRNDYYASNCTGSQVLFSEVYFLEYLGLFFHIVHDSLCSA